MNILFLSMVLIITISFVLEQVMQYLNGKSWTGNVPDKLKDLYNGEEYTKAQNYDFEQKKLSRLGSIIGFVITTGVIGSKFKAELNGPPNSLFVFPKPTPF